MRLPGDWWSAQTAISSLNNWRLSSKKIENEVNNMKFSSLGFAAMVTSPFLVKVRNFRHQLSEGGSLGRIP